MAGSANDLKLALQVKDFLHAHSFDKVVIKNYTVLLSLPDYKTPNYVQLIDTQEASNHVIYSSLNENLSDNSAFAAYSPTADFVVLMNNSYSNS